MYLDPVAATGRDARGVSRTRPGIAAGGSARRGLKGRPMEARLGDGASRLRRGDLARIGHGQFQGYEVEVVDVDEPARTVRVSMRVFGWPVSLSFSFEEASGLLELL